MSLTRHSFVFIQHVLRLKVGSTGKLEGVSFLPTHLTLLSDLNPCHKLCEVVWRWLGLSQLAPWVTTTITSHQIHQHRELYLCGTMWDNFQESRCHIVNYLIVTLLVKPSLPHLETSSYWGLSMYIPLISVVNYNLVSTCISS